MKNQHILTLIGLLVVLGISIYAAKPEDRPLGGDDSGSLNMIIDDGSPEITKEGRIVCLPHIDNSGTEECPLGFQTQSGIYYALNGGDMPDQVFMAPMNQDLRIEGRFASIDKVKPSLLKKYPIVGIITVTAIENI